VVYLLTVDGKIEEKLVEERRVFAMEEMQIAEIGSFCWNEVCEDYQKVHHGNMIKNGKTDKGVQRYLCKTCKNSFTETKGTMFYRCRHTEEEIRVPPRIVRKYTLRTKKVRKVYQRE